jgi:hypothetical protein
MAASNKPTRTSCMLSPIVICIEENAASIVDDLPGAIVRSLQKQGIETHVFAGVRPDACRYHLTYKAFQGNDVTKFVQKFEAQLYDERNVLASGNYNAGSGVSLGKFGSTASKVEPVIEKMLSH